MAGAVGTELEDRRLDENSVCVISKGHIALANRTWPDLPGRSVKTKDSNGILSLVWKGILNWPMRHGRDCRDGA